MSGAVISTVQILAAGAITAVAVLRACRQLRWAAPPAITAGALALVGVVGWRLAANALALNDDFAPLVSAGDAGCLAAGLVGPALVALTARVLAHSRWLPAVIGGLAGFAVNVVIL